MNIIPYSNNLSDYLAFDEIINFSDESIQQLANDLFLKSASETNYVKTAFEYVRDKISHSADINNDALVCTASEVLKAGHGICFAKSHLLAALLRCKGIPAGLCYQKLILDDETAPVLVYHGLNGVFLSEFGKWIRLDPRGNKQNVDAQFSITDEKLAFPIRPEKGEEDCLIVFPKTDLDIIDVFKNNQTRTDLWDDLPTTLNYLK